MIRAFVPMMENAGRGVIANFSSYWGNLRTRSGPIVQPSGAWKG